jgi:hypothetical protein
MRGYVAQKLAMRGPPDAIPSDAYMITFYGEDKHEAAEWLAWWSDPYPMNTDPETPQLTGMFKEMLEAPKTEQPTTRRLT